MILQNSGSLPNEAVLGALVAGSVKAPAATVCAEVMVALDKEVEDKLSHGAAVATCAAQASIPTTSARRPKRETVRMAALKVIVIPSGEWHERGAG
jgi:hypothetical protein